MSVLIYVAHTHKVSNALYILVRGKREREAANDPSLTTLHAAANDNYVVPRTNRRLGDRAFSVAALKAWNSLPTDLKTATCSTDAFKRRLKTWLFKRAYDWYTDY